MQYTYYVDGWDGMAVSEIEKLNEDERVEWLEPVQIWRGDEYVKDVEVRVIAPADYTLTDYDYARLEELVADER